jgi:hypothetical protein
VLIAEGRALSYEAVRALVTKTSHAEAPVLQPSDVDLAAYDALLAPEECLTAADKRNATSRSRTENVSKH